MPLSDAAYDKLEAATNKLDKINEERNDENNRVRYEFCVKMAPLFVERASALSAAENFWSGIFSSADTPVSEFMNRTIDPKIARAVTNLNVTYSMDGSKLLRKVEVTLRSNMFAEDGVISRQVDSDGKSIAVQPIAWKSGTDRARTDSLFRYFDDKADLDADMLSEITDGFDLIFQDPFLADVEED